jgi:2-polyprenyl-6-methoxyphenol hydroxylase-like FAD-dependent oxidoreductase
MKSTDICIRGAGIVGRALALLLARERLRVALVERPVSPAGEATARADVRAYALNGTSRALLESLRCWPDQAAATPVLRMEVQGDRGGALAFGAAEQQVEALGWIVDVPALERRLDDAIDYQPLIERVTTSTPARLSVVCEGRASETRLTLGVDYVTTAYPHTAIATRLHGSVPHGGVARQWFSCGEILAFLPLDGPQGNSVAVVWSVEHARVPRLVALSPEEFAKELEIASHQSMGSLTLSADRVAWPLQRSMASRWIGQTDGRSWALAGDAAHAMHPLAGQGLNVGLADAAELARVLGGREYWREPGDLRLLRRYERARQGAVMTMTTTTDILQQLFAREGAVWEGLRNWGLTGVDQLASLKGWLARQAMGPR